MKLQLQQILNQLPLSSSYTSPDFPLRGYLNFYKGSACFHYSRSCAAERCAMSRRYDTRVTISLPGMIRFARVSSDTPIVLDHYLLSGGTALPGRVCPRSYFARRNSPGHPCQRWDRPGSRAQGNQQVAGAGHIGRETLYPQRVRRTPCRFRLHRS